MLLIEFAFNYLPTSGFLTIFSGHYAPRPMVALTALDYTSYRPFSMSELMFETSIVFVMLIVLSLFYLV